MDTQTQQMVSTELKRIVADLHLSDAQKEQAKTALDNASVKYEEYKKSGKTPSKEEVAMWRTSFREKLVKFLTPEQLKTWDKEIAESKTFLTFNA